MSLTAKAIQSIAHLARIHVTEEEVPQYQSELSELLNVVEKMNTIDGILAQKAPLSHPLDLHQRTRDDVVTEHNQREAFQAIAPKTEHGLYLVNQVIE